MIDFLKENKVRPPNGSYDKVLGEAIKCHHNEIANFILKNNIDNEEEEEEKIDDFDSSINSYCFHYHNYAFFPSEMMSYSIFFYVCQYNYLDIVLYFLQERNVDINHKIITHDNKEITALYLAADRNNEEIINYLLSFTNIEIGSSYFKGCKKLRRINIPSSIDSIDNFAFMECPSLEKVSIPFSVTSIAKGTFSKCKSLKEVFIPSSITTIEKAAFQSCESLKQIKIPAAVTKIEEYSFNLCNSLAEELDPAVNTAQLGSSNDQGRC